MSTVISRGMIGTIKDFDVIEHNQYDKFGRDAFRNYLNKRISFRTVDNSNKHGIDLLTLNNNNEVIICWEIEVRHGNWQGNKPFPFKEINCIERKDYQWRRDKSFVKKIPYSLANTYDVYYVQMNKECNRAVIINGDNILNYPLKPWNNRKAQGEYVRQVPVSETTQIILRV